jgi:four helix bundle protein
MHETRNSNRFEVQEKAILAAGIAIRLAFKVPNPLRSIADQIVRSASSVPANLAEGNARSGRDRLHHFRIALASAREVDTHLRLLVSAGAVDQSGAVRVLRLFDDVRAMTWRLLYPRTSSCPDRRGLSDARTPRRSRPPDRSCR